MREDPAADGGISDHADDPHQPRAPSAVSLLPDVELAGAWWMPLDTLLEPDLLRPMEYQRYGTLGRSAGYHLKVGVLWGMTERILARVLEFLR